MKRNIAILLAAIFISGLSMAVGYAWGYGSNMSWSYPSFRSAPYMPSKYEIEQYIRDGKDYVDNCNNDIDEIARKRSEAVDSVNRAVRDYNMSH
ncbi:hypothetical protein [Selenomonas ruminantium]|uniref:Uncharacterized protein n=1 Tax=Selenomonas ruminantium TaxID=971 RepID=A0A1I0VJB2_SELRU|nr:hypothetical protein [Selenomonas ruminantium]SFA76475.1 hypothetical protein SAMN05216587_101675 [Selenomonas ruminantium]